MFRVTNFKYLLIAFIYKEPRVLEKVKQHGSRDTWIQRSYIWPDLFIMCISNGRIALDDLDVEKRNDFHNKVNKTLLIMVGSK